MNLENSFLLRYEYKNLYSTDELLTGVAGMERQNDQDNIFDDPNLKFDFAYISEEELENALVGQDSRPHSTGTALTNVYEEYEIDIEEEEEETYNLPLRTVSNSGLQDSSQATFDRFGSIYPNLDLQSISLFFSCILNFPNC